MSSIIEQIPLWDSRTVCIYVLSVFFSTTFAYIYIRNIDGNRLLGRISICMSFFSIWWVIAFATCGADYSSYERIFKSSLDPTYWNVSRIEKGYIALNAVVRLFTEDFCVFHIIWASIMLFMSYRAILDLKKEIDVPLAVLTLGAIYLFQSMSLMRIYFTMAMLLMGFKHYLDGKKIYYLLYIVVGFFFHRSVSVLILPFLFSIIFKSKRKIWIKILSTVLAFEIFYSLRFYLSSAMLFDNSFAINEYGSFGLANIIYHIPLVLLFHYAYLNQDYDSEKLRQYFIYFLASFLIGTMSYFITIFGRVFVFFAPLYMFFPAYVLRKDINCGNISRGDKYIIYLSKKNGLRTMYVVFVLFRAFMMTGFFYPDRIMPYTSMFMK